MKSPSRYYQEDLNTFLKDIVPKGSSYFKFTNHFPTRKYDYILLPNTFSYTSDIQKFLSTLKKNCFEDTRVVVFHFNFIWKPILDLASFLKLRKKSLKEPNWLTIEDIDNIFKLEGFERIRKGKRFLLPIDLGIVSNFINKFIAQLPFINVFCLSSYQIFRLSKRAKNYSVSIIIPARNEEGNIKEIIDKIPKLGTKIEIIFVEGHSKDNTFEKIKEEIKHSSGKINAFLYKQKGIGKADAIQLGFEKAKNEILIILDADLTVDPKDLKKFYNSLSLGICDFANGSRLIYPTEKQAMRHLNYLGNWIFSLVFTFLTGQHIKDTLCGTKALFKKDFLRIKKYQKEFGSFDPFGDFILLFGATKLNLKISDIPVRYRERTYGKTNISRFIHGWLLLKMTFLGARKIKFV